VNVLYLLVSGAPVYFRMLHSIFWLGCVFLTFVYFNTVTGWHQTRCCTIV